MLNTDRLCPGCMNDNGGESICSVCGYDNASKNDADKLPVRFVILDRYIVGKVIKSNAESITYMGYDSVENTAVNIKEYFPKDVCVRNPDKTVSMIEGKEYVYNEGLLSFIDINRDLIGSELPSLVPTYCVFEDNGTAYAVMGTVSGITLQSFLERNGGSLKWEQARSLFLPLIDTVIGLHGIGIVHGGISPETIMVGRDGKFRITDICIPRLRRVSPESATQLYGGYAAVEQYGSEEMTFGQHSDIYGVSATLFRVLIGKVPPCADTRVDNDTLSIPAHFADELPRQVLVAIANGLQVLPQNRTASMEQFKNELVYGETKENVRKAEINRRAEQKKVEKKSDSKKKGSSGAKYVAISLIITLVIFIGAGAALCFTVFKDEIFGKEEPSYNNSDDIVSIPDVPTIGDVDEDAVVSVKLYEVPDLLGKYYSQTVDNKDYERFKIIIKDKEYSAEYPRGTICAQSVEAGKEVENETEIEVTISLGEKQVKVADVTGLEKEEAVIELLKQGFLYENIKIEEIYDSEATPGVVIRQTPEYDTEVNTEVIVEIFINTYKGKSDDDSSTSSKTNSR